MRNKPSRTAISVSDTVAYVAQEDKVAEILVPGLAEWNERLLAAAGHLKPRRLSRMRKQWYRDFIRRMEKRSVNGQLLFVTLRKCFLDEETRAALKEGASQVLVVGAGLDTLALRLAGEFPEKLFAELDHPATQGLKKKALKKLGVPANLQLKSVDLATTSLSEALSGIESWRSDVPTVVIAEGLLMYLPKTAVRTFFKAVRESCGAGSRVLFSYMQTDGKGRPFLGEKMSRVSRTMLRMIGEPILWGVDQDKLPGFLEGLGYRLGSPHERYDLKRRFLEAGGLGERPLGGIEFVAVAELPGA
jgi:methyltransferase (TIGR00027 family)